MSEDSELTNTYKEHIVGEMWYVNMYEEYVVGEMFYVPIIVLRMFSSISGMAM